MDPTIQNTDILQACVTALIGVLVFLTLERKFERKDIVSDILEVTQNEKAANLILEKSKKELARIQSANERASHRNPIDFDKIRSYNKSEELYKKKIEGIEAELANIADKKKVLMARAQFDESKAIRHRRIKEYEDITTLITVTLLSSSITFMIFVNEGWDFFGLNYSVVSRSLFAAGLIALIARVYLYTLDIGVKLFGISIPFTD